MTINNNSHSSDKRLNYSASAPFIQTTANKLGNINSSVWVNTQDILITQGIIKRWSPLKTIIDQSFVDHYYGIEE